MGTKYQLVFNRIKVLSEKDAEYFASKMMEQPYSDEQGWGYCDVQRIGETVRATLQKRISTSYSVWNEMIKQIERQNFQIVVEIPFELDFQQNLLLTEGTNTQLNRVKQSFRQVFWNEFVYEDIHLMPVDYLSILKVSSMLGAVAELTINDFQYEGCLIGRYVAKPTSQQEILSKMGEYAKNIIRAKFNIVIHGEESVLRVTNKSIMTLESSEDAKETFVSYLKTRLV